jgi:pyruvate kinase
MKWNDSAYGKPPGVLWDSGLLEALTSQIESVRRDAAYLEAEHEATIAPLDGDSRASARNLLHYLALRRRDLRGLQTSLARLGLSSLGRAEAHVAGTLATVCAVLARLSGRSTVNGDWDPDSVGFEDGRRLLTARTAALFDAPPFGRDVRIMVTMPPEAASDPALLRALLEAGMDCMRINCAHDDRAAWSGMVENLRQAREATGRGCRILMDLGGPKLRTGALADGPRAVHFSPDRDPLGKVVRPARIWLTPSEAPEPPPEGGATVLPVDGAWIAALRDGERIELRDQRGMDLDFLAGPSVGRSRWATSEQLTYVTEGVELRRTEAPPSAPRETVVRGLPPLSQSIELHPGDLLHLLADPTPRMPPRRGPDGVLLDEAAISCTLPEVFRDVQPGQPIWFDDGKIGGLIVSAGPEEMVARITECPPGGRKLKADKGINLPETRIRLAALTAKDLQDLDFVVEHADLVGMSFINTAEDVKLLQEEIRKRTRRIPGIMLKIETRRAFRELPRILLAALAGGPCGVMIARGDLAVECGFERLAEVQEETLWLCEAAHIPVVWATQVLETLAKKGQPSRAEITDAAMGERAECVMLNKGPHVVEAVRMLDGILRRMEGHLEKKTPILRALRISNLDAG